MGPRLMGEVDRQSLISDVDPAFQHIDAEIDLYWREGFATQYPDAGARYERPSLRYYQPSVELDRGGFITDALAYYDRAEEALRINLDKLQQITPFVLAHEYGHHIQHLTGVYERFGALTLLARPGDEAQRDRISVRIELQAECLAGVWAHHAEGIADSIDEATIREEIAKLSMSAPIDTHGTGRQRAGWFYRGYAQGHASDCDTLNLAWEEL